MESDGRSSSDQTTITAGSDWDVDSISNQVCSSLDCRLPKATVMTTVLHILEKYNDVAVRKYVPILVHREAVEIFRKTGSLDMLKDSKKA